MASSSAQPRSPMSRLDTSSASPPLRTQAQNLVSANLEAAKEARMLARDLSGKTMMQNQVAQMSRIVEERARQREEVWNKTRMEIRSIRRRSEETVATEVASLEALANSLSVGSNTVDLAKVPLLSAVSGSQPVADRILELRSCDGDSVIKNERNSSKSWRYATFVVLEGQSCAGRCFIVAFISLVLLNFVTFAMSTESHFSDEGSENVFSCIEVISVGLFTIEYILRFWTSVELWPDLCITVEAEIGLRLRYALTNFFAIVDILTILPFYIDYFDDDIKLPNSQWLRVLRILRVLPPLPYAKIWSKSKALLFAGGITGGTVWILCASLYYIFERDNPLMLYCPTDDNKYCWSHFHSIPAALYLSLLNFFGEFPLIDAHSTGGRFVAMFIQVVGAAVMAIPAGALGSAFSDVVAGDDDDDDDDGDNKEDEDDKDGHDADEQGEEKMKDDENKRSKDDTQGEEEEQGPELEIDCHATAWIRSLNGERGCREIDTPLGVVDASMLFKTCICCLSLLSVLDFVLTSLTTYPGNLQETVTILGVADVLATICLCADFSFRAWASASSIQNCIGYVSGSWGLLDFTSAVVPATSSLFHSGPLLRSFTVLRILKLERYMGAFKLFWDVLMQSQSAFVVTGVFALICWMLCSTLMYYAERHNPDDDMRKYYSSVPVAMWVTLLNLSGESPICDYTVPGKIITALMGIFGVGFVTIPMGLLGGGFQDELEEEAEEDDKSQHELLQKRLSEKELALESEELTPRQKVYKFLEGSACNQVADLNPWEARAVWFEQLIFTAIFLSATVATLETVPELIAEVGIEAILLKLFELSITVLFSVEYCMRYYSAPESPQWEEQGYTTDAACRFAFVFSWPAMVDLLSIAPFYISMCGSDVADKYDGQLRMLRVFRLLTLDKYIPSVSLIGGVIRTAWKQFQLAAYAMLSLWLIFATLLWLTERHDDTLVDYLRQDQRYASVVSALPYILVHLTGDYPLIDYTVPAKVCLFFTLLFAVGVVAVPAGLMASGFSKELAKFRALQRQKALAAHSKIQNLIIGWIRRRRFRNVVRGAIAKAKQDEKRKEDAMRGYWARWQLKVDMFLEERTVTGYRWGRFMLVMIITNVLAVSFETDSHIHAMIGHRLLKVFEVFSVFVFTGQYLARVFAVPVNKRFGNKRWNYIASFWGAVDLITIAPWWIQQLCGIIGVAPHWLTHAFIFRIVRVLRILRLDDFKHSFSLLGDAWISCKDSMVACGFMALMVWVCGSVLFYNFEKDNPRMEGAFESLPSSMYYSLIFLGGEWGKIDFTPCGQVVCVFYCVMGIALYGIPVGVVFEAFSDVLQQAEENKSRVVGNGDEEA